MKAIFIALVVIAAIQTTSSQLIFIERYRGRRLRTPTVDGTSSIQADRERSVTETYRELIELGSSLSLSIPTTAVKAKSAKSPGNTGRFEMSLSFPEAGSDGADESTAAKSVKSFTAGSKSSKSGTTNTLFGTSAATSAADSEGDPEKSIWSPEIVIVTAAGASAALIAAVAVAAVVLKSR
jgi:hypothetical protein